MSNQERHNNRYQMLLHQHYFSFQASLVRAVGLEKAIILQYLHDMLNHPKMGVEIHGERWVWNTYEEWAVEFKGMWAPKTIGDHFRALENMNAIITMRKLWDGKELVKYYRINYDWVAAIEQFGPQAKRDQPTESGNTPPSKNGNTPLPEVVSPSISSLLVLTSLSQGFAEKGKSGEDCQPQDAPEDSVHPDSNRARLVAAITGVKWKAIKKGSAKWHEYTEACKAVGRADKFDKDREQINEVAQKFLSWYYGKNYDIKPGTNAVLRLWKDYARDRDAGAA